MSRGGARLDAGVAGRRRVSSRLARGDRGVVSTFDPKQTALQLPDSRQWSIALARATCRCDCAAAVATGAAGGLEGLILPLCTRSLSRVACI